MSRKGKRFTGVSRRRFMLSAAASTLATRAWAASPATTRHDADTFRLWIFGDAHVGTDLAHGDRKSLAIALRESEQGGNKGGPPFDWDIALNVGDMSGGQETPRDEEGREIVEQFKVLEKHRREDVYDLCGNHDRSGLDEPQAWWFRKWIDPTGENPEHSGVDNTKRPYPVEGTWERYSIRVGNLLFLVMSDINEPTQDIGRGPLGGNPGGVVSGETFEWWKRMVRDNRENSVILSAHHYVLKNTTTASGEYEGFWRDPMGRYHQLYHGYKPQGSPKGASYLYWVDSQPDAQAFEDSLAQHPGAVDLWVAGHTHTFPEDTRGGKRLIESRWGTHFINCAALTRYHVASPPKSRLFTFREGSDKVRVQMYLHTDDWAAEGWYARAEQTLRLSKPFHRR